MLLKVVVTFIMLAGLVGTLVPKIPGTVIVFFAIIAYGALTNFGTFTPWLWTVFISLILVAEVGGRWLRVYLTRRFNLSRRFSTSSTIANMGGILAADALLGPVLGLLVWELIVGKTMEPHGNTMSKIMIRLAAVAVLRFICGLAMIVLAFLYLFS